MSCLRTDSSPDRRHQILCAATACFAKKGFHQSSMHDISAEAGISVGLIYRYFENKDAVISALAEEHKREIDDMLARARTAPTLLESLEIFVTANCCEETPRMHAAFVVELFAEARRNPHVAELVRDLLETAMEGVTDLIARAPEMADAPHGLAPREITQLIFATARGSMMCDVLERNNIPPTARRERQLAIVRSLWRLLFNEEALLA